MGMTVVNMKQKVSDRFGKKKKMSGSFDRK